MKRARISSVGMEQELRSVCLMLNDDSHSGVGTRDDQRKDKRLLELSIPLICVLLGSLYLLVECALILDDTTPDDGGHINKQAPFAREGKGA